MNSTFKQEKYGLYAIGGFILAVIIVVLVGDFSDKFPVKTVEEYNVAQVERQKYLAERAKYIEEKTKARDSLVGSKIVSISDVDTRNDSMTIVTENGVIKLRARGYKGADLITEFNK